MPVDEWEAVKDFVHSAASACEGRTPYSARLMIRRCAPFAQWAYLQGLPLEQDVLFRRVMVERFVDQEYACRAKTTRNTYKSLLLRMGEILAPEHQERLPGRALAPGSRIKPYTPAEQVALRSWANGQRTPERRASATVLLGLGFGAGLAAEEIAAVRRQHVKADRGGVLVEVVGKRARTVPVLADWEDALTESRVHGSATFMFRPDAHREGNKEVCAGFFDHDTGGPSVGRMRMTWMIAHLTAGVPARVLLDASGMSSFNSIARCVQYLPPVELAAARPLLRGGGAARA